MQNIFKMQIMSRGTKYRLTNVMYVHTYTVCYVDLFIAAVAVPHMKFFQLACDMICGSSIREPLSFTANCCTS